MHEKMVLSIIQFIVFILIEILLAINSFNSLTIRKSKLPY